MIVPGTGVAGKTEDASITTAEDAREVHPDAIVTVKL